MNLLTVTELHRSYGEKNLMNGITFGIDEGDRIGLVGVNGAGKTTLLRTLAGMDQPDSGTLAMGGRVTIHYMPQEPVMDGDVTVLEAVFAGELPVMVLLRDYETVLSALEQHPDDESLARQLLSLQARLDSEGAWQLEHEAKTILTKLGIVDYAKRVKELSGGQKKRVAMARALIQPSDLLILDEPTNHIDDETVTWLEHHLNTRKGALLMVTHDRYFLNRVANRIFELEQGHLYEYPGNYERFLELKIAREQMQQASEEKRQNFLRNEIEWIRKGPRARGTKQKARTERYYDILEAGPSDSAESLDLSTASSRLGKSVIELDHVCKTYGGRLIINDFSYILLKSDRVGIVGPNGRGKSTLLRLMTQEVLPDGGDVRIGATVKIGYYGQEHRTIKDPDTRVIDYIREVASTIQTADGETLSAAQMLERFLFPGYLQWTPIAKLSGGERRRLELLRVLAQAPNVLLLDEPTNDLDIPTLQVLESYIDQFPGAVVAVSHDRYFLDRIANKIFAFEGHGEIRVYHGNFSDYETFKNNHDDISMAAKPEKDSQKREQDVLRSSHARRETLRFTYQEEREYERIELDIAAAEEEAMQIEMDMAHHASDHVRLQELFARQEANQARQAHLLERWAYLTDLAERMERQKRGDS